MANWFIRRYQLLMYQHENGHCPFSCWLESLSVNIRAKIKERLDRASLGNLGDHRSVGKGVLELRIHLRPGYRIYFAVSGKKTILLLNGGNKGQQAKDIRLAQKYWEEHTKKRITENG